MIIIVRKGRNLDEVKENISSEMKSEDYYDVIIIGAGLAGLSAGATLAQKGQNVIIIEQHNVVGGAATIFTRQRSMKFEVGLHEINGLALDSKINQFKRLGIYDKLDFVRVPEFYRFKRGDMDVVVPDDLDKAEKTLKNSFKDNTDDVSTYFSDLRKFTSQLALLKKYKFFLLLIFPLIPLLMHTLLRFRKITVGQYLDNLTDNEQLKLAIIANIGYYHNDPYELSMLYFAGGQTAYMTGGGFFVKGGSQNLSDSLADVIRDNGGKILLKHEVTEIILEDHKAIGVKYLRRKRPQAEIQEVYASYIIANAALPLVLKKLLPIEMDTSKLDEMQPGCSLNTIYYSFDRPVSDLTDGYYSTFFYDPNTNFRDFGELERGDDYQRKGFVFVDYTSIDSGLENDKHYTGVICGIDHLHHWNMDKNEYKAKKEEVISIFTQRLEHYFPGIKDRIQYAEMSTPKTIQRYTRNPYGTVYGFVPKINQFNKDRTKLFSPQIKNLAFASAWMYSGGFSANISNGEKVAKKVLKEL